MNWPMSRESPGRFRLVPMKQPARSARTWRALVPEPPVPKITTGASRALTAPRPGAARRLPMTRFMKALTAGPSPVPRSGLERGGPQTRGSRSLGLVVEALCRDLAQRAVPELDLEIEVVAEASHRVHRDEREAPVLHRRLVEDLAVELGGRGDGAADERQAPHQGDVATSISLRPPGADHVVGEIDLPIRVVRGGDVGEVGLGAQLGGLAVTGSLEGHPAEVLDQDAAGGLLPLPGFPGGNRLGGAAGGRHVPPPAPAALGKPLHRLRSERRPGLGLVQLARPRELLPQPLLPAAVSGPLLRRVSDEAGKRAPDRGIHRIAGYPQAPPASRPVAASITAPRAARSRPVRADRRSPRPRCRARSRPAR